MISMDKKYKTRNGRPVRILCLDAKISASNTRILGLVTHDSGQEFVTTWDENGKYPGTSALDLIEKRPRETFWLNVFYDGSTSSYKTREEADRYGPTCRIACIEIDVEHGTGLDKS